MLLLGDFILDEFVFGESERISPEAPVPIVLPKKTLVTLGCSGNVLANLNNLKLDVLPIGILGKDAKSKQILSLLKKKKLIVDILL